MSDGLMNELHWDYKYFAFPVKWKMEKWVDLQRGQSSELTRAAARSGNVQLYSSFLTHSRNFSLQIHKSESKRTWLEVGPGKLCSFFPLAFEHCPKFSLLIMLEVIIFLVFKKLISLNCLKIQHTLDVKEAFKSRSKPFSSSGGPAVAFAPNWPNLQFSIMPLTYSGTSYNGLSKAGPSVIADSMPGPSCFYYLTTM